METVRNKESIRRGIALRKAQLCYDRNDPASDEAWEMLRGAGFWISSLPCGGLLGPELHVDGTVYEGLHAIKDFVENAKHVKRFGNGTE